MSIDRRPATLANVQPLVSYFRSGWAFLLPYAALYLAYAWLKWPLNPAPAEAAGFHPPALLHLYWVLHGLHGLLAGLALRAWWRQSPEARGSPWSWIPWVALALLLLLPGAYLEFPADPWEHYGRINRWKDVLVAGPENTWLYKAGYYFLAYSFLGRLPVTTQLDGVGAFAAGGALLLSWQYYRLARTCGLPAPAAMVFTLLQAVLFGNDLFGFYRYYGLSSSIFAQIGAVAAIRIAIEWSQGCRPQPDGSPPNDKLSPFIGGLGVVLAAGFSAVQHVQGLAMAAIGIFAVLMWHAAKCGPKILLPILGALVAASVAGSLWWPRQPVIDDVYKTTGWLNAWNGFDLFSPGSAAWRRMWLILGLTGAVNLLAAAVLLRRNHIVAWLTIVPVLALQLPVVSIPLANLLGKGSPAGIVAFHRLFFVIPPGLALVALGWWWHHRAAARQPLTQSRVFALVLGACAGLTVIPAAYPYCNRLWHAWVRVPEDLRMVQTLADFHGNPGHPATRAAAKPLIVASAAISNVLQAYSPYDSLFITEERLLHSPRARSPAADQLRIQHFLKTHPVWGRPYVVLSADPLLAFTPQSQAALLSHHWNPAEVALGFVR